MFYVLLVLLVIIWGLRFWYMNYWKFFQELEKIPGPRGYPIIGTLFRILVPPEKLFRTDREFALKYYPIYSEKVLHFGGVSLLSPEDIEIVLSSTEHLEKGPVYNTLHMWLGTGLLTSFGKKWQTRRKILTPAFHFSILQEFVKVFNDSTLKLIETLQERQSEPFIDVLSPVTECTLHAIMETSMGTSGNSVSESNKYKKAVYDFGKLALYRMVRPWFTNDNIFLLSPTGKLCKKVVETLHNFSRNVINDRRNYYNTTGKMSSYSASKKMAMLDLLLKAKEQGADIDDEGIREEVDTFIFEGHDTTSAALTFILLTLANHSNVQNTVREEIIEIVGNSELPTFSQLQELNYTERCIKECLRLYPSVPYIGRMANEDIQTATGYKIPKGTMLHIYIYDLHHNPKIYPDPEKFDPDRFLPENIKNRHPFAYVPFSAGQRNCIGQRFAMLELKAVLCGVLRKFVLEPVTKPEDVIFTTDLILRTKNQIKIKFLPRK